MAFPVLAAFAAGNMASEWHSMNDMKREETLMAMQNRMNNQNAMAAYSQQVQGARMAGLNPAMMQGMSATPTTVTKGNSSKAETVAMDPTFDLVGAQADNIRAQTAKLRAEVPKVEAETKNIFADTLFKGASTEEKKASTDRINQINSQWSQQNDALKEQGQAMAQKWQDSPWYNNLRQDTKDTIDSIAAGDVPMTVGYMDALERVIKAQADLSDADQKLVSNSFQNAILETQFSDKEVMNAIAQAPRDQQKMLYKNIDHIDSLMKKIQAEIPNIVANTKNTNEATKMLKAQIKSFTSSDLGYLKKQGYETGNFIPWVEQFAEDRLKDVIDLGKGYLLGRGMRAGATPSTPSPSSIVKPGDKAYNQTMSDINRHGAFPQSSPGGSPFIYRP